MNKNILITGAGGTVGLLLTNHYLDKGFHVYAIDRSEDAVARLLELSHEHKNGRNLSVKFGDILDESFLRNTFESAPMGCIVHCAALKHVSVACAFPDKVLNENIQVFKNIIDLAKKSQSVRRVVACSSDKAADPLSSMAESKRVIEQTSRDLKVDTIDIINVRFGNILYSSGSILQKLEERIKSNKTFFVRDENMTRYILTKEDVVSLVDYAFQGGSHGDIITIKVPAIKIIDLVAAYLKMRKSSIPVTLKSSSFREAIHEALFNAREIGSVCRKDRFFVYNKKHDGNLSDNERDWLVSSANAVTSTAYKKIYE